MTRLSSSTIAFFTVFGTLLLLICFRASGSSIVAHAPIATVGLSSGWATFGEAVPEGLARDGLQVATLETQTDVKNRWPDGSIRFAVVTVNAPSSARYPISAAATSSGTFTPTVPSASVNLILDGVTYTATLPSTPAADPWLSGALVSEGRSVVALVTSGGDAHPFLRVNFDTRVYRDGHARVDTSVENLLDQAGATTVTYDIGARSYENSVFPRSVWRHCPHNRRPEPFEARA
jgi:hypothetical protein